MEQKLLPKEWEAIAKDEIDQWRLYGEKGHEAIRSAVERCFALHSKPPKELTDDECYKLWVSVYRGPFRTLDWAVDITSGTDVVRKVIAAHIRKQSEPERVKFRAARYKAGNSVLMLPTGGLRHEFHEWLEPEQTFEVVLP